MAQSMTSHTFSVALLCKWIARTPGKSKAVAIRTGISHRIVRAHRDGQTPPKDFHIAAYMALWGEKFVNEWIGEAGFGGARQLSAECPHRVLARLNNGSAALAFALADNGKVDRHEVPTVNAALAAAGVAVEIRVAA